MNIGLIIQGPIRSRAFDCLPVLRNYRERLERLPAAPACCLSTWVGEAVPDEVRSWGWTIAQSHPPKGWDLMNRRRQVLSTARGAEALLARGPLDFLLKIRTDMELPIELLLQEIAAAPPGDARKLLFPVASHLIPFHLCDFFFGGPPAVLRDFLAAAESYGELVMMGLPEMDLPLKYLAHCHREHLSPLSERDLFRDPFDYPYLWPSVTDRMQAVWQTCRASYFRLASREILAGTVWRGQPLVEQAGVHAAEFGCFEALPEANFGVSLLPLTPMPKLLRWLHALRGEAEYWRSRGLPLPAAVLTKVYLRANRWIRPLCGAHKV